MKAKTIISILLAAILILGVFPISAAAENHPDILRGDTDLDGEIAIIDVTLIQRHLAEFITLDELSQTAAHCDFRSDELDITDAAMIQRWLADISDKKRDNVGLTALIWDVDHYIPIEEDYQRALDAYVEECDFNGVLYVTRNGHVLCQSASGKLDSDGSGDITVDSLFQVGSITKQMCASAIMLLKEQGKLDTSDTLDKYYPNYKYGSDITLRDLLTMQSGIKSFTDYIVIEGEGDAEASDLVLNVDSTASENKDIIKGWLATQELDSTPGTKFYYNNSNFFILADIVEMVSGMPYQDFMKQNVFAPLGMDNTGFYEDFYNDPRYAQTIATAIDPAFPLWMLTAGITFGCGDVVSCAKDMDIWLNSLYDCSLLTKESIKEMTTGGDANPNYGYGISRYNDGSLMHTGSVGTYLSIAFTDPGYGYNLFIATNQSAFPAPYINDDEVSIEEFAYNIEDYTFEL